MRPKTVFPNWTRKYVALALLMLLPVPLLLLLLWPAPVALACACCADTGEWFIRPITVAASDVGQLNRIRFSPTATLFQTEGGLEVIEGIQNPAESYTLTQTRAGRQWRLRFHDQQGHVGILLIRLPASATSFGADLHDGSQGGGGGPLLYKEWRGSGGLQGTGIFRRGITSDARFRLVLQGRGNSCENVEDYKHWLLEVSGRRARYAFYGTLAQPAPAS